MMCDLGVGAFGQYDQLASSKNSTEYNQCARSSSQKRSSSRSSQLFYLLIALIVVGFIANMR